MTVEAAGKLREHRLAVFGWSPVACLAVRNPFVLGMAFTATDLSMQTGGLCPFGKDCWVTLTAGFQFDSSGQTDLQGLVHIVAG